MSMSEQVEFLIKHTTEMGPKLLAHQMVLGVLIGAMRSVLGDDFRQFANHAILHVEKMVEDDPDNEVVVAMKEYIDDLLSE